MRITIIGFSGSGKTTLAKKIGAAFNIPHQQIDRLWFGAGGPVAKDESEQNRVREHICSEVETFIQHPSWVSDGFYKRIQYAIADRADTVVVLELPLWRRLLNHFRRVLHAKDRHPEVTKLQDFLFAWTIIKRTFIYRPAIRTYKEKYKDKLVVLRSFAEIDTFFKHLLNESGKTKKHKSD